MRAVTILLAALLAACGASLNNAALTPESTTAAEGPRTPAALGSVSGTAANATVTGSTAKAAPSGAGAATIAPELRSSVSRTANGFISTSAPGSSGYKIGPQDLLEVAVFQVPDLSRTVQVSDTGTIGIPLIGDIQAGGRTAKEVEVDVTRRLKATYLQNPQVSVLVKEYNAQRVTIEGAVKKPGVIPLRGNTSLLQAIAMSDGLDQVADQNVVVFRQGSQGRMAARFDIAEIRAGTADDPLLQAGDVVVVGTSFWREQFNAVLKALPLVSIFALL